VHRVLWTANATYDARGEIETVLSIAHDITHRERMQELERRFLQEQLMLATERARTELRHEVRQRSLRAREEEKRRIARELDQEAERLVAGVRRQLRQIDEAEDLADVRAVVEEVTKRLAMAGQELKGLARGLRPPALEELGIVGALERLGTDLGVPLTVSLLCDPLRGEAATVVYRAAQAAIVDVAGRPTAVRMRIRIAAAEGAVQLSIGGPLELDASAIMGALRDLESPAARSAQVTGTTIRFELPPDGGATELARECVTVVLGIEQTLVREAARQALRDHDDLVVIAEASTLAGVLRALEVHRPSVLVLDLAREGGNEALSITAAGSRSPSTRVLAFCSGEQPAAAGDALRAGASGCVDRCISTSDLVAAIRDVAAGRRHVDPALEAAAAELPVDGVTQSLTQRELEVFELLALGHTNHEIGEQLVVSARTVEAHRTRLQQKLGVRTRAELVRCALSCGLLRLTA
jgi:two-component system response regulator NreC